MRPVYTPVNSSSSEKSPCVPCNPMFLPLPTIYPLHPPATTGLLSLTV